MADRGPLFSDRTPEKAERPPSQRSFMFYILVVLALAAVVPVWLFSSRDRLYRLLTYSTAEVSRADVLQTVSARGVVKPLRVVEVSARLAGTVERIDVAPGQEVREGQVLLLLSAPELELKQRRAQQEVNRAEAALRTLQLQGQKRLFEARAALGEAKNRLADAAASLDLRRRLYALGVESKNAVDEAERSLEKARNAWELARLELLTLEQQTTLEVSAARQALSDARANLGLAQAEARKRAVRAPFTGRVNAISVQPGQEVVPGDRLFMVGSLQMEVIGDVSEDQAALVRPGQRVRVSLPGGERQGRVKAVASQAEKGDGGNVVKTSIEVPRSRDLLPNSSVGLEIVVNERKAVLTLPRGPYLASGSERIVYRLVPGVQRAERREVVFGARDATRVEILRGLDEGDRVITSSYDAFKDQPLIEVSLQGELR